MKRKWLVILLKLLKRIAISILLYPVALILVYLELGTREPWYVVLILWAVAVVITFLIYDMNLLNRRKKKQKKEEEKQSDCSEEDDDE